MRPCSVSDRSHRRQHVNVGLAGADQGVGRALVSEVHVARALGDDLGVRHHPGREVADRVLDVVGVGDAGIDERRPARRVRAGARIRVGCGQLEVGRHDRVVGRGLGGPGGHREHGTGHELYQGTTIRLAHAQLHSSVLSSLTAPRRASMPRPGRFLLHSFAPPHVGAHENGRMIDPSLCYYFGAWEAKTTSRSASCGAAWWRVSALWRRLPQTAGRVDLAAGVRRGSPD